MKYKVCLLLLIFLLFCVQAGFSAESEFEKGDFWIGLSPEAAFYNYSGVSYGGGFALGYGRGSSIGLKAIWFMNMEEKVSVLELNFLLRFYFSGQKAYSGSFLQFMGGPVLVFGDDEGINIPSELGAFSIGLGYGYRFLIMDRWFIEPFIRGGYPYKAGAGLSVGARF